MKNNLPDTSLEKNSNIKEISDGVYVNLNSITSDKSDFEKAIQKSFEDLEKKENSEIRIKNSKTTENSKKQ